MKNIFPATLLLCNVVECSTNVAANPAFTSAVGIIYGSDTNVTSFVDDATGRGPRFYRVRVEQ